MPQPGSDPLGNQIAATRRSLKTLDRSLRRLASIFAAGVGHGTRRRPRLSAKARASLVLQGRYIGYMRQLKPKQKAQVRKIRDTKGVRPAISLARKLGGV